MGTDSSGRCGIPPHIIQRAERLLNAEPPMTKAAIARAVKISRATLYRIIDGSHFSLRKKSSGPKRCICGLKLFTFPCPRCGSHEPQPKAGAA